MNSNPTTDARAILDQPFITISEACQLLRVSKSTVYRLIARGVLKASKRRQGATAPKPSATYDDRLSG